MQARGAAGRYLTSNLLYLGKKKKKKLVALSDCCEDESVVIQEVRQSRARGALTSQ